MGEALDIRVTLQLPGPRSDLREDLQHGTDMTAARIIKGGVAWGKFKEWGSQPPPRVVEVSSEPRIREQGSPLLPRWL